MSIWAVLFLEFWKRKSERMAQEWNYNGDEEHGIQEHKSTTDEHLGRPNNSSEQGKTKSLVWYGADGNKRMFISTGIFLTMTIVVIIVLVAVMVYEQFIGNFIYKHQVDTGFISPKMFAEFTLVENKVKIKYFPKCQMATLLFHLII